MAIGARAQAHAAQGGSALRDTNIVGTSVPLKESRRLRAEERAAMRRKVGVCVAVLVVLAFLSFGVTGAAHQYAFYNPLQVARAIAANFHDLGATITHWYAAYSDEYLAENVPGYGAVWANMGVVFVTLVCGALLSLSGMLFQNVFKNPLAGPGMLGATSGVSLGIMVLVVLYGTAATSMTTQRYALCYGMGALVLAFVMLAGKWISGARPLNLVDMLLVGSITSQLLGVVVSFVTLWVLDDDAWMAYYTISQMLIVDTSPLTWVSLGVASVAAIVPVWLLRFRLNGLALDDAETKLAGINPTALKAVALLCGSVMILAAQIHMGAVGMVSLVVPFLARSYFGCEFRKQFAGNVVLGMILLLLCRDVVNAVEFVGAGLGIGSIVGLVVLPVVVVVFARGSRAWE